MVVYFGLVVTVYLMMWVLLAVVWLVVVLITAGFGCSCVWFVVVRACVWVFVFGCFYGVSDYATGLFGLNSFASCLCVMACYGCFPVVFGVCIVGLMVFGVVAVLLWICWTVLFACCYCCVYLVGCLLRCCGDCLLHWLVCLL